ncbi:MAG: bacterial transcriptional activator domain-containing protein [Bacillota bacterium]
MNIKAKLIGKVNFKIDNKPITNNLSKKSKGLLIYILLEDKIFNRKKLANLFWKDFTTKSAYRNLRHSLWNIRSSVKKINDKIDIFENIDKESIRLNPEIMVKKDIDCLNNIKKEKLIKTNKIYELINIYDDDLLSNFYISGAPEFNNWLYFERENFKKDYFTNLFDQGLLLIKKDNLNLTIKLFNHLTNLDPYNEDIYFYLIKAYIKKNDKPAAIKIYNEYKKLIREELNISPSNKIKKFIKQIKKKQLKNYNTKKYSNIKFKEISDKKIIIYQTKKDDVINEFRDFYLKRAQKNYFLELTKIPGRRLQYEGIFELAEELKVLISKKETKIKLNSLINKKIENFNEIALFNEFYNFIQKYINQNIKIVIYNFSNIDSKTIDFLSFIYRKEFKKKVQIIICYDKRWENNRINFFIKAIKNQSNVNIINY